MIENPIKGNLRLFALLQASQDSISRSALLQGSSVESTMDCSSGVGSKKSRSTVETVLGLERTVNGRQRDYFVTAQTDQSQGRLVSSLHNWT
jgi:hypothetical protein